MSWVTVGVAAVGVITNLKAGRDRKAAADFEAAGLQRQGQQDIASSQRDAEEQRHQAQLVASRVQALAGGGGGDPTVMKIQSGISAEGEYRALTALYGGTERAAGRNDAASARMLEGKNAQKASYYSAASSLIGAGGTLYGRYGGGGPTNYNTGKWGEKGPGE